MYYPGTLTLALRSDTELPFRFTHVELHDLPDSARTHRTTTCAGRAPISVPQCSALSNAEREIRRENTDRSPDYYDPYEVTSTAREAGFGVVNGIVEVGNYGLLEVEANKPQ